VVGHLARPEHLLAHTERVGDTAAVARARGAATEPPSHGLDIDLGLDSEIISLKTGVPKGLSELLVPHVNISPTIDWFAGEL
jgi:hypothetical protein